MKRPGTRIRALAARWFAAATMARLIDPAVADLQAEYADAQRRQSRARARIGALLRGYIALAKVAAWAAVYDRVRSVAARTERRAVTRLAAGVPLATAAFVLLLVLPQAVLGGWATRLASDRAFLTALFWSTLPPALALGVLIASAAALRSVREPRRLAPIVLLVAIVASVASLITLGWTGPRSSERFRVSGYPTATITDRPRPSTARRALTLRELSDEIDRTVVEPDASATPSTVRRRSLRFDYHRRWAMATMPVALAMVMLTVAVHTRKLWLLGTMGIGAVLVYLSLRPLAIIGAMNVRMPVAAAAWTQVAGVVAFAVVIGLVGRLVSLRRTGPARAGAG